MAEQPVQKEFKAVDIVDFAMGAQPIKVDDAFNSIIGKVVQINTIENKTINLNVPAGTQYGTTLKIPMHGMYNKEGTRGDLLVQVLVKIPENLTEQQLNICKKLRDDE